MKSMRVKFLLVAAISCLTTVLVAGTARVGAQAAKDAGASGAVLLTVKGVVQQELQLTAANFRELPRLHVTAKDHDSAMHEYEGVALPVLLAKAGVPASGDLRGKNMTLAVVAEAGDGYRAAFSLAEMDGDFAGETVAVVDTVDGKALGAGQGPLRLVVPGDKRQGRWVRMLKAITVVDTSAAK